MDTIKVKRHDHPDKEVTINLADYNPQTDELADGETLPADYVSPDKRQSDVSAGDVKNPAALPDANRGGSTQADIVAKGGDPHAVPDHHSVAEKGGAGAPPPPPAALQNAANRYVQQLGGKRWFVVDDKGNKVDGQDIKGYASQADAQAWNIANPA